MTHLPSRERRAPARLLGFRPLLLALSLLAGCGSPTPPQAGLMVAAWPGDHVTLELTGTVVHPHPLAHALTRPWIPLRSVAEQGSRITAGAALAEVNTDTVARWSTNDRLQLREQMAQQGQEQLRTEQRLADLERRRVELSASLCLLDAELAALALRDAERIAIARRELEDAQRTAARAAQTLERTRRLHASGFASGSALAAAENQAALKSAAVAVPEYALLLLEHGSTALTRRQKQLDRARQSALLDGLEVQLEVWRQAANNGARTTSRDLRRVEALVAQWDAMLADPAVRARADGVVALKDASIRAGAKPSASPFAYVLDDAGLIVEALVSDRLRGFIAIDAPVEVRIAALDTALRGRIRSVAAAPEPFPDGSGGAFRCRIALLAYDPGVRPGMAAQCTVTVDLAGRAPLAQIPTWALSDRRQPSVLLADGSRRVLDAAVIGRQAVVFAGLAPGEVIAVGDAPRPGVVRAAGTLDPAHFLPLRVATGQQWELVEMLDDGAQVEPGDQVARLAQAGWRGDLGQLGIEIEVAELAAAARLAQARAGAAATLAEALAAWRSATQAAERARLDLHIALLDGSSSAQIASAAATVRAEVALRQARSASDELAAPGAEAAYSADDAARRHTTQARAVLALRRARIEQVAAQRAADHAAISAARAAVLDAEGELDLERGNYLIDRLQGQQQIAGAQLAWRDERARQQDNRQQAAGTILRAPRAGQVFRRPDANGKVVRIGDQLHGREIFIMPLDDQRLLELEVPARFYGRFAVGGRVPVVIPALGATTHEAWVVAVAAYFADPAGAKQERASQGSVGVPERIFRLTLGLNLTSGEARRAPPGSIAYVDL